MSSIASGELSYDSKQWSIDESESLRDMQARRSATTTSDTTMVPLWQECVVPFPQEPSTLTFRI